MKIGVDLQSLMRLPRCGMHHHTYEILRNLAEHNPVDHFFVFFPEDLLNDPSRDERFLDGLGPRFTLVPLRTIGPTFRTAQMAWRGWHLPRAVAKQRVDVFHGFSHDLAYVRGCPTVVTVHDLMPAALLSWTPNDPNAIRRRRALVSAVRRATGVCAVSEATKADVVAVDPRKAQWTVISPNAVRDSLGVVVDAERRRVVLESHGLPDRFLLTIGADTPRRNYAGLLDALAAAWRQDPSLLPLVIVGEADWPRTRVFQHAQRLAANERIRFLTHVSDDHLAVLQSAATAYVCPSLHEGFGMPVLEAMACGTRVLCSDLPVLHEVAGETVEYFSPSRTESMARVLVDSAHLPPPTPEQRTHMMTRARQFTWARSARQVYMLYERVVAGARS